VPGGTIRNLAARRYVLSKTANTYARVLLGVDIHDITAGYRAYRRQVLEKIDLAAVDSKGYCFQIDLTWRAINAAHRRGTADHVSERELGVSKMSGSNIREAMFKVAEWGIRGRIDRARGRQQAGTALAGRAGRRLVSRDACLDDLQPLLEQLLELLHGATLQQHVPVRAGRLDLLGLGHVTLDEGALQAVAAQPGAGDLGVVGERNVELLAVLGGGSAPPAAEPDRGCDRFRSSRHPAAAPQDTIGGHRQSPYKRAFSSG
jgi:hypothetical protein